MSDVKISGLPSSTGVNPTSDYIPIVHNGTTEKITPDQLIGGSGFVTTAQLSAGLAPKADTTTVNAQLATKVDTANLSATTGAGLVGITPTGNIASTTVAAALNELDTEKAQLTALAATSGASLVGYIGAGTGAVARTVQSKERDVVSVKDFGAVGDGVTDDTVAIQNAINYCNTLTNGGTVIIPDCSNYYSVSRLISKSKVTIIVPNRNTRIVSEKGLTWDTQTSFSFGGYYGNDYSRPTKYSISALTKGNTQITFTTSGDSSNFIVGDVIWINSTAGFPITVGPDTYFVPAFSQLNVVTSVSTGVIGLRHSIHESRSVASVSNFSRTGLNSLGGTTPLEAVRDFKLLGGTWANTFVFASDGGCIDSEISPDVVIARNGCLYGNAFAHVQCNVKQLFCTNIPIALALGAHNTTINVDDVNVINSSTSIRMIEISEGARDNVIKIKNITFSGEVNYPVQLAACKRNTVLVDTINANVITYSAIQLWAPNYPGATELIDVVENNVDVNNIKFTSTGTLCDLIVDSTVVTNNNVYVSGFGTIYGVSDVNYPNTYGNIINAKSSTWYYLNSLIYNLPTFSVVSSYTKTTTILSGNLKIGDNFFIVLEGTCSGSGSTKSIDITFGGTNIYTVTIPTGGQNFSCSIKAEIASNTLLLGMYNTQLNVASNVQPFSVSPLNFTTTSYNLILTASNPNAGDALQFRTAKLSFYRENARL